MPTEPKKLRAVVFQRCQRCERDNQPHSIGFDVCRECRRIVTNKRHHFMTDAKRAANRRANTAFRERQRAAKAAGLTAPPPDAPPPIPPAIREARVDKIATKETAALLNPNEKRALTVEEAASIELARRELARRKLMYFIKRRNPKYRAGWVHEDICTRLERFLDDVANERSPRLMLFMPPRHGKSMLCSEEFPAWGLGLHPDWQMIATSYGADLAYDFSRKVQGILTTPDYGLLFETRLRDDMTAMDLWATTQGGRYCAAGVGGPLTGRGAHVLLIDDPIKNREQADNPTERKKIKDWYTSTAYSRLMPGGGVLVIQTRWHDDDLSGWLIACMQEAQKEAALTGEWPVDADRWEVVEYPAIAIRDEPRRKKGEALHPQRYPLSALLKIKRTTGERDWSALYQQNPVPEEGSYFTKEMLRYYEGAAPTGISTIAACDLAISKADGANYSVVIVVGVDEKDDIYVLDVLRGRWDANEIVDSLIHVQRTWAPQLVGIERTHVEQAIGPFLEKRIREEKLWSMAIEPLSPGRRDKPLRAKPIQGRMRQGKVLLPRGKSFLEWFIPELLRFPNGVHDDGVDALAWIGQMMNMVQYTPPTKPTLPSWKDRLDALTTEATHFRNPSMAA